jgi:hypothetical protein
MTTTREICCWQHYIMYKPNIFLVCDMDDGVGYNDYVVLIRLCWGRYLRLHGNRRVADDVLLIV